MKTCITCIHARRAGNPDMAGCKLWTDIYQGNNKAVTAALRNLSKKLQWGMDMDVPYGDEYIQGTMTNFCVIVDPNRFCTLYKSKSE